MHHFARIEGFDWDEGNLRKSAEKHGVNPAEAEEVFQYEPLMIVQDAKHSDAEPRFQALGRSSSGRRLHVTFTLRRNETLIRVISARDMNRKERRIYEKDSETDSALPE